LYNILSNFSGDIEDSLAVGQKWKGDERVILFCKMVPGSSLNSGLLCKIKTTIREQLSPRHVPAMILMTPEIPYTINGKKVEVAVKKIISGESVVASGTLVNPSCLDYYRNLMIV
jgi:acetoacetyl-CoA synthetase